VIDPTSVGTCDIEWHGAVRIIRSVYQPVDLFEDIADPADWPLLISAEQKTNPRLVEGIGNIDLVPPERRIGGPGASYLMAPFTHVSTDRPSRFSDGVYGVLYAGNTFETALLETMHHHARFMAQTMQEPGWTSQFRELSMAVHASLHDLRDRDEGLADVLAPDAYGAGQRLGSSLRELDSEGVVYPSVRCHGGECVGLFFPDKVSNPTQGRHLDYHWNGAVVDLYRDAASKEVFRVLEGGSVEQ
jgi:hypothetical protein